MRINFNIDYRTQWGESVYICGDIPQLGSGDESKAVKMELDGVGVWSLTVDVEDGVGPLDSGYLGATTTAMCAMNGAVPTSF